MDSKDSQSHQIEAQSAAAQHAAPGPLRRIWNIWNTVRHNIVFQIAVALMCAVSLYHGISESHAWTEIGGTSHRIAASFRELSAGKMWGTIAERERTCEYHWLFVCTTQRTESRTCFQGIGGRNVCFGTPFEASRRESSLLESAAEFAGVHMWGRAASMALHWPDTAFYLLTQNFNKGGLPFAMALLFVAIVMVLFYRLMKINPVLFPVWMLVALFAASALYSVLTYLIMSLTIVAAALMVVIVMIAAIPRSLIDSCEGVAKAEEAGHLLHEVREVGVRCSQMVSNLFKTTA